MTDEKPIVDWSEIEIYKIEFDYLKHLTTICTGSILLIIAFLEKLFTSPQWKPLIAFALVAFLIAIALCAFSMLTILDKVSEKKSKKTRDSAESLTIGLLLIALIFYVLGIMSLVAFGVKNIC